MRGAQQARVVLKRWASRGDKRLSYPGFPLRIFEISALAWGATVVCLFHADAYRFCVKDLKAPPPFYYDTILGTFMISGAFHASDGEVKGVGT